MKTLFQSQSVNIPEGVEVTIHSREIVVKGKYGELRRRFEHLPVEIVKTKKSNRIRVNMYYSTKALGACLRTLCSHLRNMMNGVSKKFEYKMRFVYAHFPINVSINDGGRSVEIRNFLGEKKVRTVGMLPGVICEKTANVKDEIALTGTDIELVSRSAALLHQSTLVRKKDIRKFLDGIYVSESGFVEKDE